MLRRLGAEPVEVRKAEQLDGLDGLVIPGGESTTFMRLMRLYGLDEALRTFGGPMFGTCAGMIVLDRRHLGLVHDQLGAIIQCRELYLCRFKFRGFCDELSGEFRALSQRCRDALGQLLSRVVL